jgi:hypothetical protein
MSFDFLYLFYVRFNIIKMLFRRYKYHTVRTHEQTHVLPHSMRARTHEQTNVLPHSRRTRTHEQTNVLPHTQKRVVRAILYIYLFIILFCTFDFVIVVVFLIVVS